jgi:hypothetical protein
VPKLFQQDSLTYKARKIFPISYKLDLGKPVKKNLQINYKGQNLKGSLYSHNNKEFIIIETHSPGNLIRNIYLVQDNQIVHHLIDNFILNEKKLISYTRNLSNVKLIISPKNFNVENFKKAIRCKFIKKTNPLSNLNIAKIITFDIECYLDNLIHIPYACAFYTMIDDKPVFSYYYITDYATYKDMLSQAFIDIITKYNGYIIYVHNLSKYDIAFLHEILNQIFSVKYSFKDNKILSIKLKWVNDLNMNEKSVSKKK